MVRLKFIGESPRYIERHREIISDPLNLLIEKDPKSGYIVGKNVILHNGHKVAFDGPLAYYREFSDILILNRGIHEPLEEFCFQELLKVIDSNPLMIELGAYWGHYSMWMLKNFPNAKCILVEPDKKCLRTGKYNFKLNNYNGEFINEFVSQDGFNIDGYVQAKGIENLDLLHSDIQGYELEMLDGAKVFLKKHGAKYLFVSTHSGYLHSSVVNVLKDHGYDIEVSSDPDFHTTSSDGFVLASAPNARKVFNEFSPMGRLDILKSKSLNVVNYLARTHN